MSVTQILHEIETLPTKDRRKLFAKLTELNAADVPESFRESMAEAARGELLDMDEALTELNRP